jgi:hypothetical protein
MKIIWGFPLILLLSFHNNFAEIDQSRNKNVKDSSVIKNISYIRDTLYTLQPFYLEINLTTQTGYLHSRDGSIKPFGISTGNEKLKDGINTKEGLFVIQSKMTKWYSRQFDSTLMLNWMGFNYGTGFHALKTSGYYRNLGKKKSSHGCVRISRAIAKMLFDTVKIGTPVLIHKGTGLITIAFTDSTKKIVHYSRTQLQNEIALNYKQLYTGRYLISQNHIIIDKSNVGQKGLPLGDPRNILKGQVFNSPYLYVQSVIPANKGIVMLNKPSEIAFSMEIPSK